MRRVVRSKQAGEELQSFIGQLAFCPDGGEACKIPGFEGG